MSEPEWQQVEPGWWCHPVHGGLCRERDGLWHHWRLNYDDAAHGPWRTLKAAMAQLSGEQERRDDGG